MVSYIALSGWAIALQLKQVNRLNQRESQESRRSDHTMA